MVERRASPAAAGGRRRCGVRVGPTRLEGMPAAWPAVAAVKAKWPVSGGALSHMILGRCWGRGVTAVEAVGGDGVVRWDSAGEANRFRFDVEQTAAAARAGRPERGVFFSILYGFQEQGRGKDLVKLEEIGTAMISLEECCWEMQLQQQHKRGATQQQLVVVPIRVRKDGWASDAMLYVNVELVDANTPSENIGRTVSFRESTVRTTTPTPTMRDDRKSLEAGTYHEVLDLKQLLDLADREHKVAVYSRSKRNSDSSSVSSMSSVSSSSTISISSASSSGGASPEPGLSSKRRLLPWRRKSREFDKRSSESLSQELPMKYMDDDPAGSWETREFTSRDAETKLRTPVFFASIDQRDDSAGGESACTALVAVLAAALHANHPTMPTRPELDALIRDGSSEWRRLCDDEAHMARFPNRHFDLDTVLAARARPIAVQHDRAFVGFFQPESFASLSGAMSFDDIWREITASSSTAEADVYIVSWNDHFFVLKVEGDCYYVVDTLGERLFEGCDKAYMLRFDATSEMRSSSSSPPEKEEEEVIVTGKECCREFIKRFLAAIPLREELEMERKGCADAPHRRLQIEFHFTRDGQSIDDPPSSDAADSSSYIFKPPPDAMDSSILLDIKQPGTTSSSAGSLEIPGSQ
uniref:C2 NT-type domain-containing protein n=1 Tax=Oryza punctata TaxID=4537 RepID=A0A0E0JF46_ORYPU